MEGLIFKISLEGHMSRTFLLLIFNGSFADEINPTVRIKRIGMGNEIKIMPNEERSYLAQKVLEVRWRLNKFIIWPVLDRLFWKRMEGVPKSSISANEAKRFLSQRILETAHRDGVDFDNLEEKMLYWTAEHEDMDLADNFAEKHNDDDYEKKVIRLLKNAYEHDLKNGSIDLQKYNDAYSAFQQGDHYLTVMLDKSLGNQLARKGKFGDKNYSNLNNLNTQTTIIIFIVLLLWLGLELVRHFWLGY
jgi:hypothetical protein